MSKIVMTERVYGVDILAILFGMSAWIAVNGLWVESPILVQRLPEKWKLASYIVVITQFANIGPIIYSILKFKFSLKKVEKPAIHVTLAIGSLAILMLVIFWDRTMIIDSKSHSIALLALTGCVAIVDCTTSVLYLPFMAHYKPKYLMSYLIGQGLSGLVPSVVALIQGISGNPECQNSTQGHLEPKYADPRFSIEVFFIFLFVMVLISWAAFILLNTWNVALKEKVKYNKNDANNHVEVNDVDNNHCNIRRRKNSNSEEFKSEANEESIGQSNMPVVTVEKTLDSESTLIKTQESKPVSRKMFITLLLTQSYVCALTNGVLPSIQTYSSLPYGNMSYHLSVTLSSISNPIACFLAFYLIAKMRSVCLPVIITIGSLSACFIMTMAVMSPSPLMADQFIGKALIVIAWISFTSCFAFVRACIASTLRASTSGGHKSLFFCGVFTQIGSAIGAVIMFVIVNYTHTFVSFNPCKK